jgi:hypothetical protein
MIIISEMQYVSLVADFHLNRRIRPQIEMFLRGFHEIIPSRWIGMFSAEELQIVISGSEDTDINVNDWKEHTRYERGYSASSRVVVWFWSVVEGFTPKQKSSLLRFVTSCSRPPLLGFADMNPPFTIASVDANEVRRNSGGFLGRMLGFGETVSASLPTSATCFNTLKLPSYSSKKVLEEKLLQAMEQDTGFGLQ